MTTTPEQLQAWCVKFESRYDLSELGTVDGRYINQTVREAWGNYVEAREDALQETEQAIKDAKHLKDILDVVYNRFELKQTDKDFLFSFGIFKA